MIQLMRHKWDSKLPYPAFKTLAKRMGISDTAAREHARRLESKKYLTRILRDGLPNQFDLKPLFEALEQLQEQAQEEEAEEEEGATT